MAESRQPTPEEVREFREALLLMAPDSDALALCDSWLASESENERLRNVVAEQEKVLQAGVRDAASEFPRCHCGERKLPYSVFFVAGAHDLYVCPKCGLK